MKRVDHVHFGTQRFIRALRALVLRCLKPELAQIAAGKVALDSKSRLQQLVQTRWQAMPSYQTVAAEGPDHAKVFTVEVLVDDRALGQGQGRSKKEAESKAAQQALKAIDTDEPAPCQASELCT